jgi:hypothetical protein
MQKHSYVLPEYDIITVKWDAFRNMGSKLKSWRHQLKHDLNIQLGDTLATVRVRVGKEMLSE